MDASVMMVYPEQLILVVTVQFSQHLGVPLMKVIKGAVSRIRSRSTDEHAVLESKHGVQS